MPKYALVQSILIAISTTRLTPHLPAKPPTFISRQGQSYGWKRVSSSFLFLLYVVAICNISTMRTGYAFLAALSLSLTPRAAWAFYLQDEWIGKQFFEGWTWETLDDPTHGRVNYLSQADALRKNLTYGAVLSSSALLSLSHVFSS